MGIFGSSRSAVTRPPRSSPAQAAASARRSPPSSPAEAAGWSAATSTKQPRGQRPTRIVAAGGEALATRCDVAQLDDVIQLAKVSQDWLGGPPTVVVNNAGVGAGGTAIGETEIDDWNWVLGINLWGPIHGCHVFAPILKEAGYGGIINVASAAAFAAAPGMAAYNVSKAGVLSLSETLSAELSGTGVNVTVLCPTFVKTNIVDSGRITEQVDPAGRPADALDRVLPRAGGPHVPGHPRSRRPVLHAATRCPDRLGHQAFHPDGVHPRRRSHARVSSTQLGGSRGHRHGRHAGEDQGPPVGAGRHRLGRTGRRDDHRRAAAQAEGVHGRPVLDREHRRHAVSRRWRRRPRRRPSPRSTATSTPRSSATPTPNWR